MPEYKQIIILRKDLNMRKGKMVSQGAHASVKAILDLGQTSEAGILLPPDVRLLAWLSSNYKKITVYVNSEAELLAIYEKAKNQKMICALIQDSGLTEFKGVATYTAVAIGPELLENIDVITKELPLL